MTIRPFAPTLTLLLFVAGCAHDPSLSEGQALIDAGNVKAGLAKVEDAVKHDPSNRKYQIYYYRQRDLALRRDLAAAQHARAQGDWDTAESLYHRMLELDSEDPRAKAGIASLAVERRRPKHNIENRIERGAPIVEVERNIGQNKSEKR